MADRKIRWGIVSTADIGMKKVTPGIMKSPHSEVVALASRELAASDLGRADELLAQCPEALRGWEWSYLYGRAHVPRKAIRKHADQVLCVAYSSDGERLASGGRDGTEIRNQERVRAKDPERPEPNPVEPDEHQQRDREEHEFSMAPSQDERKKTHDVQNHPYGSCRVDQVIP